MPIQMQSASKKLMCGNHKIAKMYCKNHVIYSSGSTVTYYVDAGTAHTEEVDEGASCLSPKTFAPAKSGWEFVGWRQDKTASGSVLGSLAMGDAPVTLYAVFRLSVTVTYYNGTTSASSTSGYRYYNNGVIANPSFKLYQVGKSGWAAKGWSTSQAAAGEITYANGTSFARDSNIVLYGMYYHTVTLTYYNGSSIAATTSGTRYYNSGSELLQNPVFNVAAAALSGWTFRGWATGAAAAAGVSYSSISNTAFASSATLYATYYQTITLTYNGNSATAGSTASQSGTRYYNSSGNVANPSFALRENGFARSGYTFSKWALNGTGGTQYAPGASVTLGANATMYAVWVAVPAKSFAYTGGIQTYTVPATGLYRLEVWGAAGGAYHGYASGGTSGHAGGAGGKSVGYKVLSAGTQIYIAVGGSGAYVNGCTANVSGGYNGGGDYYYEAWAGPHGHSTGGGATHIALKTGLLSTLGQTDILIVAGGGGGAGANGQGGAGGGTSGGNGVKDTFGCIAQGGTQSAGGQCLGTPQQGYGIGQFGQGGRTQTPYDGAGGGGFYGGSGAQQNGSGGGGSGYIGGVPAVSYNGGTYAPSMASGVNSGAGQATITFVG